jgi:hypothetical protein
VRVLAPGQEAWGWPEGADVIADGPPISARARAALISDAIGTPVRLEELSPDEARRRWLEEGWPAETIEVTLWAQTEFLAHPLPPNPTIDRVLGRPAPDLPAVARVSPRRLLLARVKTRPKSRRQARRAPRATGTADQR